MNNLPITITFKNMEISPTLQQHIADRSEKFSRYFNRIQSCRVIVDAQHAHHDQQHFDVRVEVDVPGKSLISSKQGADAYLAADDALLAMDRQISVHHDKLQSHDVGLTEVVYGAIVRLMQEEGYGFIEGNDGQEYYFSNANVSHHQFKGLTIGDSVKFHAVQHDKGLQAHHVEKLSTA